MIRWPSLIGGTHKIVGWLNSLLLGCRAAEIKEVKGQGRLISNTDGKIIEIYTQTQPVQSVRFRIYQSSDWLTYRVGSGVIIATGDPITILNPEDEDFPISDGVSRFWFYIEMTSTTAEIKTSATTLTWSSTLIPIGWVDTATGSADEVSTPYQFIRDDIFNPCVT